MSLLGTSMSLSAQQIDQYRLGTNFEQKLVSKFQAKDHLIPCEHFLLTIKTMIIHAGLGRARNFRKSAKGPTKPSRVSRLNHQPKD